MKVALVDGDVSYPATSGKCLRTLNLMLRLAEHHEVTYLARANVGAPGLQDAECFSGITEFAYILSRIRYRTRLGLDFIVTWPSICFRRFLIRWRFIAVWP